MSSASLVAEFRQLNADLSSLAVKDMEAFMARLDVGDVAAARDALAEFTTALVDTYGKPAALLAAQFYDDMRAESPNATGRFRAIMADPASADEVMGTVRWAVDPLVGGVPDKAAVTERMSGAVQRYVTGAGRDTIDTNTRRDRSRPTFARVPHGAKPCDFCLMIASRGAVYSEQGANSHYHDHCSCVPTPMWRGDPYPEGYDPDALYDDYQARQVAAPA